MKRTLMISAALALLTPVAANAQETNADAPVVNAPEAVIFSADEPQLDDLSVEDLNSLQLARLEQSAYDIALDTGNEPVVVAEETVATEEPVFTIAEDDVASDAEDESTAMGGPFYESEEDAIQDSDLTDAPDEPAETPLPVPEEE